MCGGLYSSHSSTSSLNTRSTYSHSRPLNNVSYKKQKTKQNVSQRTTNAADTRPGVYRQPRRRGSPRHGHGKGDVGYLTVFRHVSDRPTLHGASFSSKSLTGNQLLPNITVEKAWRSFHPLSPGRRIGPLAYRRGSRTQTPSPRRQTPPPDPNPPRRKTLFLSLLQ